MTSFLDTLFSCLREDSSISSLAMQYISHVVGCTSKSEQLCSTASICGAFLEDPRHLQMSKDVLRDLCLVLDRSPINSLQEFRGLYSGKRCTNAARLLQLGVQYHDGSIVTFASNLLAGFCSILQDASTQEGELLKEEAECLDAIREMISSNMLGIEGRVLLKLQTLLEARAVANSGGLTTPFRGKRGAQEADRQSLFLSLMNIRQDDKSGWASETKSDASAKMVEPEIANLLHFLVRNRVGRD